MLLAAFIHFYGAEEPRPVLTAKAEPVVETGSQTNRVTVFLRSSAVDEEASVKGSLTVSVIRKTPPPPEAVAEAQPEFSDDPASGVQPAASEAEPVIEPAGTSLPEGVHPMLRAGLTSKSIEIGNFEPVTLAGGASDCIAVGQSLLSSAGGASTLLDILVSNPQITISRICASNGSVILTCRAGKMTISPRKANGIKACGAKDSA